MINFNESMVSKYGFPNFNYLKRTKNVPARKLGINDAEFIVKPDQYQGSAGEVHPAYDAWHSMLERCMAPYQTKKPTYIGVSCCIEWLSFSNFAIWFKENYVEGFTLDKDLIKRNNKIYSPDTCLYVPVCINSFLTTSSKVRGDYPQGVTKEANKAKFRARISENNKREHLGYFNTVAEAHVSWQRAKIQKAYDLSKEFNIPQMELVISRIESDICSGLYTEAL